VENNSAISFAAGHDQKINRTFGFSLLESANVAAQIVLFGAIISAFIAVAALFTSSISNQL